MIEIENKIDAWRWVLISLERETPVLFGEKMRDWPAGLLEELLSAGMLRELPLIDCYACRECYENVFCDVVYDETSDGTVRAVVCCPNCGPYQVPLDDLRVWEVDRTRFVTQIGNSLGLSGRPHEVASGRLWRLGCRRHHETSWSVWLGSNLVTSKGRELLMRAGLPPRTLLLVPDRMPRDPFPEGIQVCSLNEITSWSSGTIQWNDDRLEELLACATSVVTVPKKPAPTRRQTRASDIEALVKELKQHIQSARAHAFFMRDARGTPALLPRPSQKELALRLGITESRVSRSLNDAAAHQLQLLWSVADDVDQVMRFG